MASGAKGQILSHPGFSDSLCGETIPSIILEVSGATFECVPSCPCHTQSGITEYIVL